MGFGGGSDIGQQRAEAQAAADRADQLKREQDAKIAAEEAKRLENERLLQSKRTDAARQAQFSERRKQLFTSAAAARDEEDDDEQVTATASQKRRRLFGES
jgi:hypothetical protein